MDADLQPLMHPYTKFDNPTMYNPEHPPSWHSVAGGEQGSYLDEYFVIKNTAHVHARGLLDLA